MNYLKTGVVAVILLYLVYGIFFPELPVVNADELWETSRGYYLLSQHHPGEPMLPTEVSPFYSSIGKLGWKSWWIITAKSGSFALMMDILPVSELTAMRLTMFLWSVLACLLTYFLALRLGLKKWFAMLSVAILISLPDFFSQIHRERSEILICASLLAGILLFLEGFRSATVRRKRIFYFLAGAFAWLPSFLIHPSSIIIPGAIGILYLIFERKNIFSLNTIIIGIGLVAGSVFFLFLMNSMKEFAVAAGGGDYFKYQGPPILVKGLKYFISLPYAFYTRFMDANILARPFSFLVFATGIILIIRSRVSKQSYLTKEVFTILAVTVFASLFFLYILSGSFGNYNVIVAPFIAIAISFFVSYKVEQGAKTKYFVPAFLLLILFASNAVGINSDIKSAREYKKMTAEVRDAIPSDGSVLGLALYYNPFKNQHYYSNSWFNPYAGRIDQSFEEAVRALNVNYVIVDDAFVGRALLDRGNAWTDSMMNYLSSHGEMKAEFDADYFVGNRVPEPEKYLPSWRYEGQRKKYIGKIKIFRITS